MQCNFHSFIQIINLHGIFRNALRCRKTGACRILVPLRYLSPDTAHSHQNYIILPQGNSMLFPLWIKTAITK